VEETPVLAWIIFGGLMTVLLTLDLFVFHRKAHEIHLKEALLGSAFWIGIALIWNVVVWQWLGPEQGLNFLTAYLVEKSLSVDNLFVFLLIFSAFAVPAMYRHRVLFWGIFAALVLRGAFIAFGIAILGTFHWMIYLFGALLLWAAWKIAFTEKKDFDPEQSRMVRITRKFVPVTNQYEGGKFMTRANGRRAITPLFLVLIVINGIDIVFAADSVPAVLAITTDPFIAYTSNAFAILGLRALYFALESGLGHLRYLNEGLAAILAFVGIKMIGSEFFHFSSLISLGVIVGILGIAVVASLIAEKRNRV